MQGTPTLQYTGLLEGDLRETVAEKCLVIERDGRDGGEPRARDTLVASSRPPSPVSSSTMSAGCRGEREERGRRGDLEKGDRRAVVDPLAESITSAELGLGDRRAAEQDPLVEPHQMRRNIACTRRPPAPSIASRWRRDPLPLVPAMCRTGGERAARDGRAREQPLDAARATDR